MSANIAQIDLADLRGRLADLAGNPVVAVGLRLLELQPQEATPTLAELIRTLITLLDQYERRAVDAAAPRAAILQDADGVYWIDSF